MQCACTGMGPHVHAQWHTQYVHHEAQHACMRLNCMGHFACLSCMCASISLGVEYVPHWLTCHAPFLHLGQQRHQFN